MASVTLGCSGTSLHGRFYLPLRKRKSPSTSRLWFISCSAEGIAHQARTVQASFSQHNFEQFLLSLQATICDTAEQADGSGKRFSYDKWQRGKDASSGYGITQVIEGGDLLEKAAINISIIHGQLTETRAKAMSARGRPANAGSPYFAGAISLVFHPRNPYVPTFRSDVRYFQIEEQAGWFGGGADLTPCYLIEEDARNFHGFYKQICDKHDSALYDRCKAACDSYFFIPARNEHRGIGGIFFDDLQKLESQVHSSAISASQDLTQVYSFVKEVATGFMPSFLPIAQKRNPTPYGERERTWQLTRRGRYLEFNLLYDRGVKFGLDGGRIESIMVSAPPLVAWKYNFQPEPASEEALLLEVLRVPRCWTKPSN